MSDGEWIKIGEIGANAATCVILGDNSPGIDMSYELLRFARAGGMWCETSDGEGHLVSTGAMDGAYPVFVRIEDGIVLEARVVFLVSDDFPVRELEERAGHYRQILCNLNNVAEVGA